ncbi:hypothetical protein GALL_416000 [mine drainage metagenome]|uniref:Uncharacterized protein n=1 Tax=mine drainage metagenome TaxID=410659 RepID=A0A1J5Q057_9ZZZZ
MVGDGRNQDRVAQQVGTADFLDAAEFFSFDRAELGEVDGWPRDQAQASTVIVCCGFATLLGRNGRSLHRAAHHRAGKDLNVGLKNASFEATAFDLNQGYAQFAGKFAHRRGGVRQIQW